MLLSPNQTRKVLNSASAGLCCIKIQIEMAEKMLNIEDLKFTGSLCICNVSHFHLSHFKYGFI